MKKFSINSAINDLKAKVSDLYNRENGFVFPLRFKPWIDYRDYDKELNQFGYLDETPDGESAWVHIPVFIIKQDNVELTMTDMTDYYDFKVPVLPPENDGLCFYYSEGRLYTNIDLINLGGVFTVEYYSKCESINLEIELDKFDNKVPRVDSFELEMIGTDVK